MDSDAEEIWKDRLRKDVDSENITDTQSLLDEIDGTPDSVFLTSKTGKVFERDLTEAKNNLKTFVNDLVLGSGSLQKTMFDNNISDLKEAKTKETIKIIEDRFIGIPKIEFDKRQSFRGEVALRERELLKEVPEELTKEQISDLGLRSVRKLSAELDLSIEDTKSLLTDKGFELIRNETVFKQ